MGGSDAIARRIGIDQSKAPEPPLSDRPIDPARYYNRDFWKREWDKMWTRTWQIAGLVRQLQKKGDFISTDFGPETILCTLADDGRIRAFYNVCQHRGMLLVGEEHGCAANARLVCPYHGWTYDMQGKLRSVPDVPDFKQGNPCGKRNLVEIPCDTWGGFVWFNMDPACAPLRDYLSPVAQQMEAYPLEQMVRTLWVTIEGDWNWKLVQDNFNESYHVPFLHPHLKYVLEYSYRYSQFDLYPGGHCRMLMPGGSPSKLVQGGEEETLTAMTEPLKYWDLDPEDFRGRTQDIREALRNNRRQLGEAKGFDFSGYDDAMLTDNWHYTMFPNLAFSLKPDGNIFTRARPHPSDPEKCYFDMWFMNLFPKGETRYWCHSLRTWLNLDEAVPHQRGKFGECELGPTIESDARVWSAVQKGLHSRGYQGDYLAWQERRVRFFHDVLDGYMEK
ncbi:MAG TPA: aromatic ring-hydroxylating dioxygenase subunit alpha [Burkholderiales bacterium]|nr:aromatic ring-hydroxylating dioxygenase subunit alpha [Burkholderiales bacterium]